MPEAFIQGVRVFLVDDHPAVREGLSLLLTTKGIAVCGEADCQEEALRLLSVVTPDVVLVDLSLGRESGIDLIAELPRSVKTLVYSMHDDAERIEAALSAGANGYVTKREIAGTLLDAIRCILAGGCYLSPVAAEAATQQVVSDESRVIVELLSDRELEVFRRMGEGYSTTDLAIHFDISPSTVETYYARIMDKLRLSGTKDIRRRAIRFMKGR